MNGKPKIEKHESFSLELKNFTTSKKTSVEYLEILQKLKKTFSNIRDLEVAALNNFTIDYRKVINEASMSVNFEVSKLKQIIRSLQSERSQYSQKLEKSANKLEKISQLFFSLKEENSQVKKENNELKRNIESVKVAHRNMKLELEKISEDCIEKTSLDFCQKELQLEKNKYRRFFPQVSELQMAVQTMATAGLSKLIKEYRNYKTLHQTHLETDRKNKLAIRKYHELIIAEQRKVLRIGGLMKARLAGQDSCQSMRRSLTTALTAVREYKASVASQQDELAYCHNQNDQYERVLRSTNTFYSYLLQKIGQVTDGIHHLKIVGEKLR